MKALFRRERPTMCLGALNDLPEEAPTRVSTSPPIAAVRHGGTVHVFEDRCPHAGAMLSRGTLTGERLTCPSHKGVFDVGTGRSVGAVPCRALRVYEAWVTEGVVYAHTEPQGRLTRRSSGCPG